MAHEMISVSDSHSHLVQRVSSGRAQELTYTMAIQITNKTGKRTVSLPETPFVALLAQISAGYFPFYF